MREYSIAARRAILEALSTLILVMSEDTVDMLFKIVDRELDKCLEGSEDERLH